MKIENHKLSGEGVKPYEQTTKTSGKFKDGKLDTIIIHYTASPSFKSAYNTMMKSDRQASAHLLVDWDGTVLQMMSFDTTTWHAGKSSYQGRKYFNQYSIGIEIVNPGYLFKKDGHYEDVYGIKYSDDKVYNGKHRNSPNASEYWHIYTKEQISAVYEICRQLVKEYDIKHILGHEEIAVGRKTDPGPAFPLDQLRTDILESGEVATEDAETVEDDGSGVKGWISKAYVELDNSDDDYDGFVTASSLNIRAEASGISSSVADPLPQNTKFKIIQTSGSWIEVYAYV